MINLLAKTANWKFILPAFLATAFFIYLFQIGQADMNEIAGTEVIMIDLRESYTLEEVKDLFTKLKPEGRAIHQQLTAVTDMIFPFTYGPFYIFILAFFIKNIFGKDSKWLYLSLFPVLIMAIDYMENTNTLVMLSQFPDLTEAVVNKGSTITSLKQLLITVTHGLVLLGAIGYVVKKLKKNKLRYETN